MPRYPEKSVGKNVGNRNRETPIYPLETVTYAPYSRERKIQRFGSGYAGLGGSGVESDDHPAVLPALLLDLRHPHAPDLAGRGHVGAAAGLQIHSLDVEHPHPPPPTRRRDRHGAYEGGVRIELLFADPARVHGVILVHEPVEPRGEVLLVEGALGEVEVEPAAAVPDGAAGHRGRDEGAQQVQAGMYPHEPIPAVPVDAGGDLGAGEIGAGRAGAGRCLGHVDDLAGGAALAGVDDPDGGPVGEGQLAAVARLAAAERVEDGAVEADPGVVHHGDAGLAGPRVRILPEHFLGHIGIPPCRYSTVSTPAPLDPRPLTLAP